MTINLKPTNTTVLKARLHSKRPGIEFQFRTSNQAYCGTLAVDLSQYISFYQKEEYDLIASAAILIIAGFFTPSKIVVEWDSEATKSLGLFIKLCQSI